MFRKPLNDDLLEILLTIEMYHSIIIQNPEVITKKKKKKYIKQLKKDIKHLKNEEYDDISFLTESGKEVMKW